jgi:hypothetical protein
VGRRFDALGITGYRDAARHVLGLSYSRNSGKHEMDRPRNLFPSTNC